jgi:DNA-binding Xre family transcriptional regulator
MWAKGSQGVKWMAGSKHPMAKITEDDVRWIRTEGRRMTGKDLAKKFGVSVASISMIRSGRTWKHVT